MEVDSDSNYHPEEQATYKNIQEFVKEKYGVHVGTHHIAEVKRMCGIKTEKHGGRAKTGNRDSKPCPSEKVEYIKDALRYFGAF